MAVPTYKSTPGIQLLRALLRGRRAVIQSHRWIEREGVTIAEFDVIATLGNTDGLRMSELAERMVTSPQNATRLARALERRRLVVRRRSATSGREVMIRLTAAGNRLFEELYPRAAQFTIELFNGALSAGEQKRLTELLVKLADRLGDGDP